jgi:hypothetical protein
MILPFVIEYVLEFFLIDFSSAQIDGDVFVLMIFLKELADRVNGVSIQFF